MYILNYHYTVPAHPKYSLQASTRLSLRIHILTGTVGVLLPLYVFFSTNQAVGVSIMWLVAIVDLIFSCTAAFQAPNVYGMRILTIPAYYTCVALKVIVNGCLLQSLIVNPVGGFKDQVVMDDVVSASNICMGSYLVRLLLCQRYHAKSSI